MVAQQPEGFALGARAADLLVGQGLVGGGAPEVAVAEVGSRGVARAGVVELLDDLVAVVDEDRADVGRSIAVGIQNLANPTLAVFDDLGTDEARWGTRFTIFDSAIRQSTGLNNPM